MKVGDNMKKTRYKVIKNKKRESKNVVVKLILNLVCNTLVLMLASSLFESFEITSISYAFLGAIIISLLNMTIKPLLVYLSLPMIFVTFGLFYPFINVFILKITSLILGNNFIVAGWIIPFFVALFISFMNMLFYRIIVLPVEEERLR